MKKTYVQPGLAVIQLEAEEMIASSYDATKQDTVKSQVSNDSKGSIWEGSQGPIWGN